MKKTNEIIKEKYLKDKNKKGITLIALVITIVLMLILATVTVNVVIDGGLFENASDAKRNTDLAREKEDLQKSVIIAEGTSKTGRITVNDMQKALNKIVTDENGTTVIDNGDTLVVKYNKSNRYYEIYNNGKVEGPKQLIKEEYAGDITRGGQCDGTSLEKAFQINCIEDLVYFSQWSGDFLADKGSSALDGKYVKLMRTLDFNSIFSYDDYQTTIYDEFLGGDGKTGLKEQLTKGKGFFPIGNDEAICFRGIFDGQGYEIRNIYIYKEGCAGLFGKCNYGTIVKNLGITGNITSTGDSAGGIVGWAGEATFSNCYNKCNISTTYTKDYQGSGGIVGFNSTGNNTILNCYNEGNISFKKNIDGPQNCIGAGGIIGGFRSGGTLNIDNCYNIGTINSVYKASGIVGANWAEGQLYITNCCNVGNLEGEYVYNISSDRGNLKEMNNCYYLQQDFTGYDSSLATPFSKTQVNTAITGLNTYISNNSNKTTGWNLWKLGDKGYPIFQ